MAYIYSRDVVYSDISAVNVLAKSEYELVFCNFTGLVLRGKRGYLGGCKLRCSRPGKDVRVLPGVKDNIFTLGSVLYKLYTGGRLYKGIGDNEVVFLYC